MSFGGKKNEKRGAFPGGLVVRIWHSHWRGPGLILGQETASSGVQRGQNTKAKQDKDGQSRKAAAHLTPSAASS